MPGFVSRCWAALAVLLVARALATLLPGMSLWALNAGRFVPVAAAFAMLVMAVALVPALASRAVTPFEWLGDLAARAPWRARTVWALLGAGLVLALPDRTHFVGDFVLREYAIHGGGSPSDLFPQAFPADVWLHVSLPRWLARSEICPPDLVARILGAVEAGVLGVLGVELSRSLRLSGVASCVATASLLFGAALGTMTGYPKTFSELVVCAATIGVFAIRASREGRGIGWVGVSMAGVLLLHRSSLVLLPAYVAFLFVARKSFAPSRLGTVTAVAAPAIALALVGPRMVDAMLRFDVQPSVPSMSDLALHGLDVLNLLLLSPLLILALATTGWPERRTKLAWAVLGVALVFPLIIRNPRQGIFRDWDVFAAPMVLVSVFAAAHLGTRLTALARRQLWIGSAIVASIACPVAITLAGQFNLEAGLTRAEAFAIERPVRPAKVRGMLWTYLCQRQAQLGNYREAVKAGREAAALAPTRNLLLLLATSERMNGDDAAALQTYKRLLGVENTNLEAWYCAAIYSARSGDFAEAQRDLEKLERLSVPAEFMAYARSQVESERSHRSSPRPPSQVASPR